MEGGGAGIPHLQQSHSPHHQDHHLHHHLHQQHHPHDEDFLEQMLSTIPSCTWPPQPHDHPDDHSPPPASAAAFQYPFDEAFNAGNNGHGFAPGSIHGNGQPPLSQPRGQFHPPPPPPPPQSFGAGVAGAAAGPPASASTGGSSGATPQKQSRVRARRGQATDPHSIAERLRRERIAERMKALQELVPNANKTDKASMLDEIIDYVKFLQLQVKVVSMSRLGGAAAGLGPLVADMSAEGNGGRRSNSATTPTALTANNNMTATENQVARLMEEDMGSAMQYLQGKGLCLMPISLATAISTAACSSRNPPPPRTPITNNDNNNNNKVVNNTPNVDQPTTTMATASALVVDNSINDGSKK